MNFKENHNQAKLKVRANAIPEVYISEVALNKMFLFTKEITTEVGWLGTAYRDGNVYTIDDVFLLDQQVHATTTEITSEGLTTFAEELLQRPDGVEIWNNLKMWGHSHVNMGISPSGQDDKQMEVFESSGHDFFIRLICNKKGDLAVDVFDYETGIEAHNAKWFILEEPATSEEETLRLQISQLEQLLAQANEDKQAIKQSKVEELEKELLPEIKQKVKPIVYQTKYTNTTPSYKYGKQIKQRPSKQVIDGVKTTVYDIFSVEDLVYLGNMSRTVWELEDNLVDYYPEYAFSYTDLTTIMSACRQNGGYYEETIYFNDGEDDIHWNGDTKNYPTKGWDF